MPITIICECGINHLGRLSLVREMIIKAKEIGADIAKFQLYDVDTLFPDGQIMAQGINWYSEVKKTQLSKEQIFKVAEWCKEFGIELMASAFDLERLSWLEEIGVNRYKIASRSINDVELIEAIKKTGKQVIASVPYGTTEHELYRLEQVSPLYCVPEYPADPIGYNLKDISWNQYSGISDHTEGIGTAMIAMARGAKIIEKHFTLSRKMPGPDQICSAHPWEMKQLVRFARKCEEIL